VIAFAVSAVILNGRQLYIQELVTHIAVNLSRCRPVLCYVVLHIALGFQAGVVLHIFLGHKINIAG